MKIKIYNGKFDFLSMGTTLRNGRKFNIEDRVYVLVSDEYLKSTDKIVIIAGIIVGIDYRLGNINTPSEYYYKVQLLENSEYGEPFNGNCDRIYNSIEELKEDLIEKVKNLYELQLREIELIK